MSTVDNSQVILRTHGVSKLFGKFRALNNISASFPRGASWWPQGTWPPRYRPHALRPVPGGASAAATAPKQTRTSPGPPV